MYLTEILQEKETQSPSPAPSESLASPLAGGPRHKGHRAPILAHPLAYSSHSPIGVATLPSTPGHRQCSSILRTACQALHRAFRCRGQ